MHEELKEKIVAAPEGMAKLDELAQNMVVDPLQLVGSVLDGKIRIDERIGAGGMGVVYKGFHLILNRPVAVKVLHTAALSDPEAIMRFKREALAAFELTHPNVVATHDVGVHRNIPYLVQEFVDGVPLSKMISDVRGKPDACIRMQDILEITQQALSGLSAAHAKGVIHRDIKPANLLIVRNESGLQVKIADFGLAKVTEDGGPTLTKTGEMCGSPPYMSTEQCLGHKVDTRTDLYSMGCVLFELVTGHCPFMAENIVAIISHHVSKEIPSLSSMCERAIPPGLEVVIQRAMCKDRDARYQTAEAFAADVAAIKAEKAVYKHRLRFRKAKTPVAILITVSMFLLIAIGMFQTVAVPSAVTVLTANEHDPRTAYQNGQSALQGGDDKVAEAWFRRCVELSPDYANAWWGIGSCQLRQEKSRDAQVNLEKAVKLGNMPRAWHDLSLAYQEQGKYVDGEKAVRKAVAKLPNDPQVWLTLGAALEGQNKFAEAEAALKKCAAIDPNFRNVQEWIAKVRKAQGK